MPLEKEERADCVVLYSGMKENCPWKTKVRGHRNHSKPEVWFCLVGLCPDPPLLPGPAVVSPHRLHGGSASCR